MTDSLQIGIDPLGVSLWNTAVHPLPAAWLGAHASRPRSQPVLVALSSPASPPDFAPSGSTAVIIDDQLFFIFTMAIKTHAQALFLYYLLRNIGTCLASFNHVTAHSLQTGSHLLTPRSLCRARASCSSGIGRSPLGGLHRRGWLRLDVTRVKFFSKHLRAEKSEALMQTHYLQTCSGTEGRLSALVSLCPNFFIQVSVLSLEGKSRTGFLEAVSHSSGAPPW